jgi:hypothetical protein
MKINLALVDLFNRNTINIKSKGFIKLSIESNDSLKCLLELTDANQLSFCSHLFETQ